MMTNATINWIVLAVVIILLIIVGAILYRKGFKDGRSTIYDQCGTLFVSKDEVYAQFLDLPDNIQDDSIALFVVKRIGGKDDE